MNEFVISLIYKGQKYYIKDDFMNFSTGVSWKITINKKEASIYSLYDASKVVKNLREKTEYYDISIQPKAE